jgi:hypothetical protein
MNIGPPYLEEVLRILLWKKKLEEALEEYRKKNFYKLTRHYTKPMGVSGE